VLQNDAMSDRLQRLEDVLDIQNLVSRYEYFHTADMDDERISLFASKTPGVKLEIANWGIYEGIEGVKRFYLGARRSLIKDRTGHMHMHATTTPVIEVARDGKTAKGVWIAPGHDTSPMSGATWSWAKYGIDFVKEDGKWKFWHYHAYGIFKAPYYKSWVDVEDEHALPPIPDELKADRPSPYHWMYSKTRKTENIPEPPRPYDTWDDSMSYIK
jgi:hypothetical protein